MADAGGEGICGCCCELFLSRTTSKSLTNSGLIVFSILNPWCSTCPFFLVPQFSYTFSTAPAFPSSVWCGRVLQQQLHSWLLRFLLQRFRRRRFRCSSKEGPRRNPRPQCSSHKSQPARAQTRNDVDEHAELSRMQYRHFGNSY